MGDLLKFAQKNEDQEVKASPGYRHSKHVKLPWVLLAIAHYVKEGNQESARQLLNFISVHRPIPGSLLLPPDLAKLVGRSNPGAALTQE